MVATPERKVQLAELKEEVYSAVPPRDALDFFLEKHDSDLQIRDTIIALRSAPNVGAMMQIRKEFEGNGATNAQKAVIDKCVKHAVESCEDDISTKMTQLKRLERSMDRSGSFNLSA